MDSDSQVASSSKRLKSNECKDMISGLPDSIISHILSFIPIKDAVCTCILSKRWIHLWKLVTQLVFQDEYKEFQMDMDEQQLAQFVNFVNGVMLHRDDNSCIHDFILIMHHKYDASVIGEWICAALRRKVKMLCVESFHTKNAPPPYSLLQFLSLEELILNVDHSWTIRLPSFLCLSSLTALRLFEITLTHDHETTSNNSGNITLKFPVLREFWTIKCNWFGVNSVILEAPLLELVYITRLSQSINHCGIKLCALHLKKLIYCGLVSPFPNFLDLSEANIASAQIHLMTVASAANTQIMAQQLNLLDVEEVRSCTCKLLKQFISNVERLKFGWIDSVLQVPQVAKDSLADLLASKRLTCLEIDYYVSVEFLLGLLVRTPALKALFFKKLLGFDKKLLNTTTVPDCIQSNLEVVEFSCPPGDCEYVLIFAKFIMENAQVLKRIIVYPASENLEEVKEKILSFKKACSVATIEFL